MRVISFPRFNYTGGQLPAEAAFIGIAPSSAVDSCVVGGRVLGPCAVIPVKGGDEIKPYRSLPSGSIDDTHPSMVNFILASSLDLVVWRTCDQPFNPGPRSSLVAHANGKSSDLNAVVSTRVLRINVQGRGRVNYQIQARGTGGSPQIEFRYRQYSYLDRTWLAGNPGDEPIAVDIAAVVPVVVSAGFDGNPVGQGTFILNSNLRGADEVHVFLRDSGTWTTFGQWWLNVYADGENGIGA